MKVHPSAKRPIVNDGPKASGFLFTHDSHRPDGVGVPCEVVTGQGFLDGLRPLARRCLTRHHYHHYRGFLATQRKLLDKQEPKVAKAVLYAYRVVLTGIHLLRTGEVEANLPRLAQEYRRPFLADLMAQKRE